jgi:hypothetical protein
MEMGEERGPVSDRHLIKLIVRPTLCAPSRSPEVEVKKNELLHMKEDSLKIGKKTTTV